MAGQINIGGAVSAAGGDVNIVVAERIERSFNKAAGAEHLSNDLRQNLQELSRQVEQMVKHLPPKEAEKAAQDLEKLTDEAISGKPTREWYQVSADGLVKAAKAVGETAEPVIKTVKKILPLLALLAS